MTTSDAKSENVQQMKTNESDWERVKESDFRFQNKKKANLVFEGFYSIFYAMYNYNILNNIDYL